MENQQENMEKEEVRILGRELSSEEMSEFTGGMRASTDDAHIGTCTNEQDCD